jgi:hypothetical protein
MLGAFENSPVRQKMRNVAAQVQEASLRYTHARTDGMLNEIRARHKDRIEAALHDAGQTQNF